MRNLFFNVSLLFIFCTLLFSSCEKQEINQQNTVNDAVKDQNTLLNARIEASKVSKKGDFLQFEDEKAFYQILSELAKKTPKEQSEWASQFGIVSLRNVYDQVVKAEIALLDATGGDATKLDKEQTKRLEKYGFVSETALKNSEAISYDKNTGFSINIFSGHMSLVANAKGLVQIGKEIRKYSKDGVKTILDGDESKISLLDNINDSDESKKIRVEKVERVFSNGRTETDTRTLYCESISGGSPQLKLITYDEFYVLGAVGSNTKFTHYQTTRSLRKGWFGAWYDYYTDIYLNGNMSYKDNTGAFISTWNGGAYYGGFNYSSVFPNATMCQIYYLSDALIDTYKTPITATGQSLANNGFTGCGSIY